MGCRVTAAHSTGRTRSAGTDCTYRIPGDSVHHTDARQVESGQRIQPSISPRYHTPSRSTSTTRGGSNRRDGMGSNQHDERADR